MSLGLDEIQGALKTYYSPKKIAELMYTKQPFFSMVPKNENIGGDSWKIPMISSDSQGVATDFAVAQSLAYNTSPIINAWIVSYTYIYALATVTEQAIEQSRGDMLAFMRAQTVAIDSIMRSLGRRISIELFGESSGWVGQVAAEPSVADPMVLTVKFLPQIQNFEIGQKLVIWSAKTGGSQRHSSGASAPAYVLEFTIAKVDRDAGTITCAEAYTSDGDIQADDFVFFYGSRPTSSDTQQVYGLESWLPDTVSSSDSYFGVNRSQDRVRLAGSVIDGSGMTIAQAIYEGSVAVANNGGTPTHVFMSYQTYSQLVSQLNTTVNRDVQSAKVAKDTTISFSGLKLYGVDSEMFVIADNGCNRNDVAYVLDINSWQLGSMGKLIALMNADGLFMLRTQNAASYEARYRFFGQLACLAPAHNAKVILS